MTIEGDSIRDRAIASHVTSKNAPKHAAINFLGCPDSLKNQPAPDSSEYMDENSPDYASEREQIIAKLLEGKETPTHQEKPIIVVLAGSDGTAKMESIEKLKKSNLIDQDIRDALTNGALLSNDSAKVHMQKYREDIAKGKVAASVLTQKAATFIQLDALEQAQQKKLDIICEEPYTDRKRIHDIIKQFGATHEIVFIGITCSLEKAAQRTIDRALAGEREGHFILRSYFEKSFRDAAQCLRYNLRALPSTVRKYVFDTTTDKLKPLDVKKIDQFQCAEINSRKNLNSSKIHRIVARVLGAFQKFPSPQNEAFHTSTQIGLLKAVKSSKL